MLELLRLATLRGGIKCILYNEMEINILRDGTKCYENVPVNFLLFRDGDTGSWLDQGSTILVSKLFS